MIHRYFIRLYAAFAQFLCMLFGIEHLQSFSMHNGFLPATLH